MEPSHVKLADRIGKYFWVNECEPDENMDPLKHYILFNGSVPYYVYDDGEYVHIYIHKYDANVTTHPLVVDAKPVCEDESESEEEFEIDDTDYCFEYIFSYKYDHFVDISYKYTDKDEIRPYLSLLIALNDTRYLFVNDIKCIEFESDGKITESIPEGCGDLCPYWFAFDNNYMYADDDGYGLVKIHKKHIDFTKHPLNPYYYYVYTSRDDKNKTRVNQIKVSEYDGRFK